jgi:hypothetical protein
MESFFEALTQTVPEESTLPEELDLEAVAERMEDLWQRSVQDMAQGRVVEWAATLVLDAQGRLTLTNEVAGGPEGVTPDWSVAEGQRVLGAFHTHPSAEGIEDIAFGVEDFTSMLRGRHTLYIVKSGRTLCALVRTQQTAADPDIAEMDRLFFATFGRHYLLGRSLPEAVLAANVALARHLRLALYVGVGSPRLRRLC